MVMFVFEDAKLDEAMDGCVETALLMCPILAIMWLNCVIPFAPPQQPSRNVPHTRQLDGCKTDVPMSHVDDTNVKHTHQQTRAWFCCK